MELTDSSASAAKNCLQPPAQQQQRVRKAPPKFYSVPHNKIAEQGETVRFQCNVGGNPAPRVTWDRDHIAIKADDARITFEERNDVRVLQIRNVTNDVRQLLSISIELFW